MHYLKKITRPTPLYTSFGVLLALVIFYRMAEMRDSDLSWKLKYRDELQIGYQEKAGKKQLRYIEYGKKASSLIVLIHGAPSSSTFWNGLLQDTTLLSKAQFLLFDRPGYGYSRFGKAEVSVQKQAKLLADVLKTKRDSFESIVIHGSSYGGTVAARLAMDFPDLVDGLLLQSASTLAGEEKTFWITYPTTHWSLKWMVPKALRVANAEKLSHAGQLTRMQGLWQQIRSHTIVMHGGHDWLIYPENALFSYQQLTEAASRRLKWYPKNGHDLMSTQRPEVVRSLLQLLELTLPATQ